MTGQQNSSHGPPMFAYRPPDLLPAGGSIESLPLAWFPMARPLDHHHPANRWGGGAWMTVGNKQAVIIIGQMSLGPVHYGLARPEDCDENKGYHGTPYESHVNFYSPASLIHVAHGAISPNDVQPWMRWTDQSEGAMPHAANCSHITPRARIDTLLLTPATWATVDQKSNTNPDGDCQYDWDCVRRVDNVMRRSVLVLWMAVAFVGECGWRQNK